MAQVKITNQEIDIAQGIRQIVWEGMRNGDYGKPVSMANAADKTIQVFGVFGVNGRVKIYGSNDVADKDKLPNDVNSNWIEMKNMSDNQLSLADNGLHLMKENPLLLSAMVVDGDTDTNLTVAVCGRKV